MNRLVKIILIFFLFFQTPFLLSAQEDISPERDVAIGRALGNEQRSAVIEKTMRKISIELTLEYAFAMQGEQSFELIDSQGEMASRLIYPTKGQMVILKGEIGYLSKLFLGGRYGSSDFRKTVCSDEDWGFSDWHNEEWKYIQYQITKQDCKSKVELFDANLYYRFLDLDEEEVKKRRLSIKEDTIFDFLLVDKLSLDIFAGYQHYKGRYRMVDPVYEILRIVDDTWWEAIGYPADEGLDSFYKICYKGPRLGLRAKGSKGKVTTELWFAYAWLKTEAHGYWNIRDLSFWQTGKNGYGIDLGWEITYPFTSWFSAGLGFNYLYFRQKKLKMYAVEKGTPWPWGEGYQDRIRNADSEIYGPSVLLKFIW